MMSSLRNVVILGKVGSGKRTLGNHIAGGDIFGRDTALGTGNVGAHYGERKREDTLYQILTVDTESLQTGYNNPLPYIQERFQEIHSIIFVIPHGRYTDESHGSLMHAVESLHQQAMSVSALVITHCEGMTDEQRGAIIAEFRDNARSSRVVAFMKHGTYAVGFPDFSTLPPLVKPILQNAVDRDQKAIRKVVERCESPLNVCNLSGVVVQQPYSRPSVTAALQKQAKYKKPYSGASSKYKQQRTVAEPDHAHVGLNTSQPKTAGQGNSSPKTPESQLENLRTVIILGKVGSGKKTLGDRLVGQNIFKHRSGLSGTANMTRNVGASYAEFLEGDPAYRILTVDTESLQTGYNNPISYITQHFQTVNSIIFVVARGHYTDESHGSFVHTVQNLHPRAAQISALVFTHCEGMTEQQRSDAIADFRANVSSQTITAFMDKGIYAVGFPDNLPPDARPIMEEEIVKDAETIKKLVRECDVPLPVEDLTAGVDQRDYSRSSATPSLQKCSLS